jgi:translocation and assembly module TamA
MRGLAPGRRALARLLAGLAAAALAASPAGAVDVRVDGIDDGLAEEAIDAAGVRDLDCAAAPWAVRFRSGRLEVAIRERLRDRALLAPTIAVRQHSEGDCWLIEVEVQPGPETRLRSVEVEVRGEGREALAPLLARPTLVPGDRLDEARYESFKRALHERALALGYLAARYEVNRIDAWPEAGVADVALVLETGRLHHLSSLRLDVEPDRLDDDIVERLLDWQPGAPWSLADVGELRRRLLASGYVDTVDLRSRPGPDATVALDAALRLRKRHRVGGGVGFATDIGPRAEVGYENRFLNRRGHQAGTELRASPVLSSLRGEYRLPLQGRRDPWLYLEAGVTAERTDTVEADTISASVRRVQQGPFGTRLTQFLDLSRERFEVALDDETARLAIVGLALDRTRRTALEPLELGWQAQASIRGTATPVSTTDFLQLRFQTELALAAGRRSRVLLRSELGTTWTPSIATLPASVRFFAGGDRSIRGYGLDDVGPLAANGEVRGGRHLVVGSAEFERVLRGRWSGALFVDSGGAFNEADDPWVTGVGAGLRWRSPIGPVRIDLAVPLDDPSRELRLHVGVGTLFR